MHRWLCSILAFWLLGIGSATAQSRAPQDAIVGVWLTEKQDSKIEITKTGAGYAGKVVWLKEPLRDGHPVHDAKNPDAALRERPILNLEILSGFVYDGNGTWVRGSVYSPQSGRSFPGELSLLRNDRLNIKVKDGIFFKHVAWTRASP
jgi:uncharacterized protein (DUF2147 family)